MHGLPAVVLMRALPDLTLNVSLTLPQYLTTSPMRLSIPGFILTKLSENQHALPAQVIAKLEARPALFSFKSIASAADGVILSRGNLGLDVPPEKMALVQKAVISNCNIMVRLSPDLDLTLTLQWAWTRCRMICSGAEGRHLQLHPHSARRRSLGKAMFYSSLQQGPRAQNGSARVVKPASPQDLNANPDAVRAERLLAIRARYAHAECGLSASTDAGLSVFTYKELFVRMLERQEHAASSWHVLSIVLTFLHAFSTPPVCRASR